MYSLNEIYSQLRKKKEEIIMAEGKEIKLTEETFNSAISYLTGYKDNLNSARDALITTNNDMKNDWLGDGGTAFILSAKVIEEQFKERISDLEGSINDLDVAKTSIFALDTYYASEIQSSIEGKTETFGKADDNSDNTMRIKLS